MKKNTFKSILLFVFICCSFSIIAKNVPLFDTASNSGKVSSTYLTKGMVFEKTQVQTPPDEDTSTDLSCPSSGKFKNTTTRNVDIPNAVNVGEVDDRSCYSDYSEVDVYGKTWGVYNITDGSNHWDGATLQPRIERALPRASETGVGSFVRLKGTFRILEVGDTGAFGSSGTYIAQAKGKHSGGGGSKDPAILLYRAHPVYGTGVNSRKQVAFDIYAERITVRGGEGSGREVVFLKRVEKDKEIEFQLEVGFRQDPNDASKKIHYCDAVIGGEAFNFNIPEPERGLESGIRYGAYRVRGGRAQIRWANTTYKKAEIKDTGDSFTLPEGAITLKNVATGKFLTDAEASATAVKMSDSGKAKNTHWTLVKSGSYVNIDSEVNGILRAPGSKGPGGAYVIVSTTKSSPATDNDKTWTMFYNQSENTYRFESRTAGRFLYHNENNTVTHAKVTADDNRSKWEIIPITQTLNVSSNELESVHVKVYPNPAKSEFKIESKNTQRFKVKVYDILGKTIFNGFTNRGKIDVKRTSNFKSGIYLVQVTTDSSSYRTKLVIE